MIITVVSVEQAAVPAGKKYQALEVAFKNEQGQVQGRKLMSFVHPLVYNLFKQAKQGEKYDITTVKEGDYWQWTEAKKVEGGSVGNQETQNVGNKTSTQQYAASSNDRYETKEERAARQVMIVKQSSLAQAVATLKTDKVVPSDEAVLKLAQTYTDWVLDKDPVRELIDMQDDLPS